MWSTAPKVELRLRALLEERSWSQRDLTRESQRHAPGLSLPTVNALVTNRAAGIRMLTLSILMATFDCELSDLFDVSA
jgi:DNA-binding Xre family transcriptional regulator